MKKLGIYFAVIIALFAILFFVNNASNKAKEQQYANNPYGKPVSELHPQTVKDLSDPNYQNLILPEELEEKMNNKESFFVYFFQPTCQYCRYTTPILNPIAEEAGIDLKLFNLLEFSEGWERYNIEYTPTLVYFKDGRETDRIVGGIAEPGGEGHSEDTFKQFFAKHKG